MEVEVGQGTARPQDLRHGLRVRAFLVQAARYMAERLLEAWDAAKKANPDTPGITPEGEPSTGKPNESLIPDDPDERKTYAMRIIAQRCLYGVDVNPLAADMAKLSLWLLTLARTSRSSSWTMPSGVATPLSACTTLTNFGTSA